MKVIGFAEQYYTLWNVEKTTISVNQFQTRENSHFIYIQNLSKDLNVAMSKVNEPFKVDLELKGEKRDFYTEGDLIGTIPDNVFKFGKYKHKKIEACEDVKYIYWYYNENNCKVSLEHLLKNGFELIDDVLLFSTEDAKKELHYLSLNKGHFFENKERVFLSLKTIHSFGFDTAYGYTHVVTYETKCGKEVKYMGSSPTCISDVTFEKITATIKHSEYKEVQETRILRIKKIN